MFDAAGGIIVRSALVYIATDDLSQNANYLGPSTPEQLAAQIAKAEGPSGPNFEYVYKLAAVMRGMGAHDAELFELESRVRVLLGHTDAELSSQ